jgi:hypothetical protein
MRNETLPRETPSATTHPALKKLRQRESEKRPTIRELSRYLNRHSPRADEHAQDPHVEDEIVVPAHCQVLGLRALGVADGEVRQRIVRGRQGDSVRFGRVASAVGISG